MARIARVVVPGLPLTIRVNCHRNPCLRALDKGAHLVLGVRPRHPLADEDERGTTYRLSWQERRTKLSWHQRPWKICAD